MSLTSKLSSFSFILLPISINKNNFKNLNGIQQICITMSDLEKLQKQIYIINYL